MIGPNTDVSDRYKGGIHHVLRTLREDYISEFTKNGIELSFFNTERISRSAASQGKFNASNIENSWQIYRDCSIELTNNKYDAIVYASSTGLPFLKDLIIAKQLKQRHKIKVILQIHFADIDSILIEKYKLEKYVLRLMIDLCDGCIFLSQELLSQFVFKGFPRDQAYLLYNYHDMTLDNTLVTQKLAAGNDNPKTRFIFMGSFNRRKGLYDLFEAFETLDPNSYILDLCGGFNQDDTELKEILEKFCNEHRESVIYHGYLSDNKKDDVFLNADVCVLPSYAEGLPVVLLEAMAAGCAVIATDVGAVPEIIKRNRNGILISPGDIQALRNALLLTIQDKILLKTMQNHNYHDSSKYTAANYVKKMCSIIESVITK